MSELAQRVFVEKYRPHTVDDCILPKSMKSIFQSFVDKKEFPNLMLSGTQGSGKTTVAMALCEQLGYDYILINSSEDRNIDMIRNTLRSFCSTVSMTGARKAVILDEADNIGSAAAPALRGFIEEFSNTCTFILTCNYKEKIIEPIHSRTANIDYSFKGDEAKELMVSFMKRCRHILTAEGVEYEDSAVAFIIQKYFPDFRRVLNELQKFSMLGNITLDVVKTNGNVQVSELWNLLKNKEFTKTRKWVAENASDSVNDIFRMIYESASEYIEAQSIPRLVILVADYQYKAAFSVDHEINMMAFFVEIMADMQFKP